MSPPSAEVSTFAGLQAKLNHLGKAELKSVRDAYKFDRFGGGFVGRCAGEFGEPLMKEFVRYTRRSADRLHTALEELEREGCGLRIALTHFSPVADTLAGEPLEIYPFLGSYLLAEAIDTAGADLAVHGHAHMGSEHGMTAGGVRVRNVAQPVIRRAFNVYQLHTA